MKDRFCDLSHVNSCDNCKLLHDEIYNKHLFNCIIFLILVAVGNSFESIQLGYWEGGKISGGEIS